LRAGRRRVHTVWVAGRGLDGVAEIARAAGATVHVVDAARVGELARTDAPQGVLADADPLPETGFDTLLAGHAAFLVALDGVTDPQNLGAVMRVAEAAGATGVIVPRHRSARITPAAAKAAAGAVEYLALATVSGIPAALQRAERAGVWSIGLDAEGETSIFDVELADRSVMLVLGAEGRGLARLTRERCDLVARIPMRGHVPSLNVATAAAIACTEIARRRGG
jgi:23S rRNA (guanosine2251-2'-O)-methyltransferase